MTRALLACFLCFAAGCSSSASCPTTAEATVPASGCVPVALTDFTGSTCATTTGGGALVHHASGAAAYFDISSSSGGFSYYVGATSVCGCDGHGLVGGSGASHATPAIHAADGDVVLVITPPDPGVTYTIMACAGAAP